MAGRTDTKGLFVLMDRYCDGDPRAFARLHAALTPRLRGFLIKLVRDETTADDLLQLTFLKAHLARERFYVPGGDPDGAVQGWYFAIARNVALDHLRQRGRRDRREVGLTRGDDRDLEFADAAASIEDAALRIEHSEAVIEQVREALAQLPPGQREVVELHKLRGMSMAEVAERLDIREGAARVRAHRGYKALARLLGAGMVVALICGRGLAARGESPRAASLGLFAEGGVAETRSTPGTTSFRLLPLGENPGARRHEDFHHGLLG